METISTTVMYKGYPIKVENKRVYLPSFGTTINNHSMHWSYIEVPVDKLTEELREELENKNLI